MSITLTQRSCAAKEVCGICLDPLLGKAWGHLSHRFHGHCLASWVKDYPNCPICRVTVDATSLLGKKVLHEQKFTQSAVMKVCSCVLAVECIAFSVCIGIGVFLLINALLVVAVVAGLGIYVREVVFRS